MAYSRLPFERILRIRSPLRGEQRQFLLAYADKAEIEALLTCLSLETGHDLAYDWLLADPMGRIIHCQSCAQVPGVDEATAYELHNEGMRDGHYWAEFSVKRTLLCSHCQRRQKALRRLIRMRGWTVKGEYGAAGE